MVVLIAVVGAGLALRGRTSGMDRLLLLQKVEKRRSVHKITLQNMSLLNTNILFLAASTLPTSCIIFTVSFTVFDNFALVC